MLFLDSHGVVIRIGPLDVEDLMNPGILQPLGWLEDRRHKVQTDVLAEQTAPLTVAIYPGIELYKNYLDDNQRPKSAGDLEDFLFLTGAGLGDVKEPNKGVIRLQDEKTGGEVAVEMLLDPDNTFNRSAPDTSSERSSIMQKGQKTHKNKGDLMLHTLTETFKTAQNVSHWQRAFQLHQPLRNLFWQAFNDVKKSTDNPDPQKIQAFWDKCAAVTVSPERQKMQVWRLKTDAKGVSKLVRKENDMPELVLHTPWTKEPEYDPRDPAGQMGITRKAIQYIDQPTETKKVVKRACKKAAIPKKELIPKHGKIKL
ncbi:MAG: hypothetical protein ACQEQL_05070 [Pseudomonadota bacterium]